MTTPIAEATVEQIVTKLAAEPCLGCEGLGQHQIQSRSQAIWIHCTRCGGTGARFPGLRVECGGGLDEAGSFDCRNGHLGRITETGWRPFQSKHSLCHGLGYTLNTSLEALWEIHMTFWAAGTSSLTLNPSDSYSTIKVKMARALATTMGWE